MMLQFFKARKRTQVLKRPPCCYLDRYHVFGDSVVGLVIVERSSSASAASGGAGACGKGITGLANDNVTGQMEGGGVVVLELEHGVAELGLGAALVGDDVEVHSVVRASVG